MARRWFGPSQKEIWHQLSEAVGGRYLEGAFRPGIGGVSVVLL
jgi:hypothetical protein